MVSNLKLILLCNLRCRAIVLYEMIFWIFWWQFYCRYICVWVCVCVYILGWECVCVCVCVLFIYFCGCVYNVAGDGEYCWVNSTLFRSRSLSWVLRIWWGRERINVIWIRIGVYLYYGNLRGQIDYIWLKWRKKVLVYVMVSHFKRYL